MYIYCVQRKYDKETKTFIRDKIVENVASKGIRKCVVGADLTYEKHYECLDNVPLKPNEEPPVAIGNRKTISV